MPSRSTLSTAVAEILFREWDPIGVNDNEACLAEYDGYVPGVVELLLRRADEFELAARLRAIRQGSMGLTVDNDNLDRSVARRLLLLVETR